MRAESALVVVDASVVPILFNNRTKSNAYAEFLEGNRAFISFQTLEERLYGAYLAGWEMRRMNELTAHIGQYTVIWPNSELVEIAARIRAQREQRGRRLHVADAWIAATALLLNCPLVADDNDFDGIPNLELLTI